MINLYEYQKQYLADLPARAIMAADTGTGKTFMALAHYEQKMATPGRAVPTTPLLILAPAAKIRTKDWEREIQEWFGDLAEHVQYEIYSYEMFSRKPSLKQFKEGKKPVWWKYAPKFGGQQYAVIADECHRAKNPQSGIGRAVYEAAKGAQFFMGLSATPLPNGWIDFANYSKIWGFTKGITEFKTRYVRYVPNLDFPKIAGYANEAELTQQWQSISKKLDKKQALDLPARTFIGVNFEKPTEYTKVFKTRQLTDGTLLDSPPLLAHALRQTLTAPKMDYLSDLIEGTTENIVVFYNYITEREAILDMLVRKHPNKTVFRQDGQAHELPSKPDWPNITNSVTLAQFRSGSTGVEMTYATQVIYFSPTYSYADYIQSIGRVHRNGQEAKTTFYNFRTPNTIEAEVYECLRTKNNFQEAQWKGYEE